MITKLLEKIRIYGAVIFIAIFLKVIFFRLEARTAEIYNMILDIVILLLLARAFVQKVKFEVFLFKDKVLKLVIFYVIHSLLVSYMFFILHNLYAFNAILLLDIAINICIITVLVSDISILKMPHFLNFLLKSMSSRLFKTICLILAIMGSYVVYRFLLALLHTYWHYDYKMYKLFTLLFYYVIIIIGMYVVYNIYKEYIDENRKK